MNAKGCARPCRWKDARRYFYWALRARLATIRALAQFASVYPESTPEYRKDVLRSIAPLDDPDNKVIAEALETIDLSPTLTQLRAAHIVHELREALRVDRPAAVKGVMRLAEEMSEEEKAGLVAAIQSTGQSSGKCQWPLCFLSC